MADFTINNTANSIQCQDIVVNIKAPTETISETAVPGLLPGQKPNPQAQKSIYGEIPQIPTLDAVDGIKFDFNHGIRILFPHNNKTYHVTFLDIDTGVISYSADTVPGAYVTSVKKFFIKFRLIIHEKGKDEPIFTHDYDCRDKVPDAPFRRLQADNR